MAGVLVRSLYKGLTEQSSPSRLLLSQGDEENGAAPSGDRHAVSLPASAYKGYSASDYLNPFVWFAIPSVLFLMSIAAIALVVYQKQKANGAASEAKEELDENESFSSDKSGFSSDKSGFSSDKSGIRVKKLSVSEKSVVRKSFIKKFSKEADKTLYNGYLYKKASRHVALGYQRRYFKLSHSGKLTYSKSIFSMHNNSGKSNKKSKTFFLVNPNIDSPTILAPASSNDSTDIKIIFSRPDEDTEKLSGNIDAREVLELRAETVKDARLWRAYIEKILQQKDSDQN